MTKSKTWKKNRDSRRTIAGDQNMIELSELDALIPPDWERGWADHITDAQIGIVYIKPRGSVGAVRKWPAYAGHGERSGPLIPRESLTDAAAVIREPKP